MKRAAGLTLALCLTSVPARADLPDNGERIQTHDYAIDLSQTPVLAGSRVTGLAGAYVAIGEGIDGIAQNPGAVALRTPWSTEHFDFDLGIGITFSSALTTSDVFNSGRHTLSSPNGQEELTFLGLAASMRLGRWGFGVSTDLQSYTLNRSQTQSTMASEHLLARFAVSHTTVGYGFLDNQWLVGAGIRGSALDVVNTLSSDEKNLFSAAGIGLEGGVLFRPTDAHYRVGLCVRAPVNAKASPTSARLLYEGDPESELYLPSIVALPWELNMGFAIELGRRPLNPRLLDESREFEPLDRYYQWQLRERARKRRVAHERTLREGRTAEAAEAALDAELDSEAALDAIRIEREHEELSRRLRERARGMPRSHLLLSASLDVLGPVGDAVGVESFLERAVQRSGRKPSFSPRLGLETEAIPAWTRLRAGTYIEPSRFEGRSKGARTHLTLGFDQRLFRWEVFGLWAEGSIWMLSASLDVARQYVSSGIGIGMWH